MRLLLIRRVETNKDAGTPGEPTAPSPDGLAQIKELADICRENQAEAVICSSEARAVAMATELGAVLSVPTVEQGGIEERDFGDWNTWEWPQIKAELDKLSDEERYTFIPPNGESWQQMDARLGTALRTIAALPHKAVAVVTHYGPIRALLPVIKGEPRESTLQLTVDPGQYFIVEYPKS